MGSKFKLRMFFFALLLCVAVMAQAAGGPTFYYVVTAVDANGFESAFSNQVTATFGQGQHTANLSWIAPTPASGGAAIVGYNISRSSTSGGPYAKINSVLVTGATSYSDAFVPPPAPSGLTVATQ